MSEQGGYRRIHTERLLAKEKVSRRLSANELLCAVSLCRAPAQHPHPVTIACATQILAQTGGSTRSHSRHFALLQRSIRAIIYSSRWPSWSRWVGSVNLAETFIQVAVEIRVHGVCDAPRSGVTGRRFRGQRQGVSGHDRPSSQAVQHCANNTDARQCGSAW